MNLGQLRLHTLGRGVSEPTYEEHTPINTYLAVAAYFNLSAFIQDLITQEAKDNWARFGYPLSCAIGQGNVSYRSYWVSWDYLGLRIFQCLNLYLPGQHTLGLLRKRQTGTTTQRQICKTNTENTPCPKVEICRVSMDHLMKGFVRGLCVVPDLTSPQVCMADSGKRPFPKGAQCKLSINYLLNGLFYGFCEVQWYPNQILPQAVQHPPGTHTTR